MERIYRKSEINEMNAKRIAYGGQLLHRELSTRDIWLSEVEWCTDGYLSSQEVGGWVRHNKYGLKSRKEWRTRHYAELDENGEIIRRWDNCKKATKISLE